MIDYSNIKDILPGQMTVEECMQELESYKWKSGQYMNLPEMEEKDDEHN